MKKGLPAERKGFSIVEMMLYMGLMAILLSFLTQTFLSVLNLQSETQSRSSVEADGRYLLTRLSYDIHRGSAIVSPALGQSASTAILTIDDANYTYSPDSGNLILTTGGSTHQLNSYATKISNLSFTRLGNPGGNNTLQIKFTLTGVVNWESGPRIQNFETTIGQRCNNLSGC